MIKIYKKGAMFGLDARIALAIFGALSVISGAALYSAIQTAKAEQARQMFIKFAKASEAYYLDNYSYLPISDDTVQIYELAEDSKSLPTWKGPYVDEEKNFNGLQNFFTKNIHSLVYFKIYLLKSSDWPDSTNMHSCVKDSPDCSEWITLYNNFVTEAHDKMKSLFYILDDLVDNSDGSTTGNVRYQHVNGATFKLFYKGIPRKKTT